MEEVLCGIIWIEIVSYLNTYYYIITSYMIIWSINIILRLDPHTYLFYFLFRNMRKLSFEGDHGVSSIHKVNSEFVVIIGPKKS